MAMDEELLPQGHWTLQLKIGEEITLLPGDNEAFLVTDVFLVDPDSAHGQGIVEACVKIGTKDIVLAELSSESEEEDEELLVPEVLDKEFCFYVARPGGDSDTHTDANANGDAIVVQFVGFMVPMPPPDTEEGKEGEEESDGAIEPDVASASSAGDNIRSSDVLSISVSIFLFVCVLELLRFIMSP